MDFLTTLLFILFLIIILYLIYKSFTFKITIPSLPANTPANTQANKPANKPVYFIPCSDGAITVNGCANPTKCNYLGLGSTFGPTRNGLDENGTLLPGPRDNGFGCPLGTNNGIAVDPSNCYCPENAP